MKNRIKKTINIKLGKVTQKMEHHIDTDLGWRLFAFRKLVGVSQETVGKSFDLHQTAVCRVEQGLQKLTPAQVLHLLRLEQKAELNKNVKSSTKRLKALSDVG